jgi:hypothetical protein
MSKMANDFAKLIDFMVSSLCSAVSRSLFDGFYPDLNAKDISQKIDYIYEKYA